MNVFEERLREQLPRPQADPRFRRVLLERLLLEAVEGSPTEPRVAPVGRRRAYVGVGGAFVGAAALAVGVAVRVRRRRGDVDTTEAA